MYRTRTWALCVAAQFFLSQSHAGAYNCFTNGPYAGFMSGKQSH